MTIATTEQTSLAISNNGANLIREAAAVMVDAHTLAKAVCNTQMIPKHFQGKPDECAAAMLYGASLGLDPMQSVRQIYVVHGQAALYARAMVALTLGAGHQVWTVASTDESVTVAGQRKGSQHAEESTWTFERAKKAGYTNNDKYRTDPQAMLYSKAASEVCRKIAPDVLNGVYAVEELQMEQPWDGTTRTPRQIMADAPAADRMRAALGQNVTAEQIHEPERAEDAPMTKRTRGQMFALFAQKGISEDEQLPGINHIVSKSYESRGDVTEADALEVIRVLQQRADASPTDQAADQ